jgi:hypothetical protein
MENIFSGLPGREMLHLEGFFDIIKYLDQNNPEALKAMEAELQEIIDRYKEKYKTIEVVPYEEGVILRQKNERAIWRLVSRIS